MAAEKFKVGDRVRVKKIDTEKPIHGISPRTLKTFEGREVDVRGICGPTYVVSINGTTWYFTDEMLEPIPAELKFKAGDPVRILSYPGSWSSGAGGSHPVDAKYPINGIIEKLNTKYDHTAIKVLGYGFNLDVLIKRGLIQLIEPITPAPRWYVGQSVWDDVIHPGTYGVVDSITSDRVIVQYDTGQHYYFFGDNDIRFLSAVPYTFELPPQPEPIWIPEKWERVLVRGHELDTWRPHIFFQYLHGTPNPFQIMGKEGGCWKYCIPFDPDKVGKL